MSVTDRDEHAIPVVPLRHYGRWIAAAVMMLVVVVGVKSVATNSAFEWSVVREYLTRRFILDGLVLTVELTVVSMAIGVVGGVALAVMRLSANPLISGPSWLYIWFFRGTPVLLQIIFWFNISALYPEISLGIPFGPAFYHGNANSIVTRFVAVALALGLNEAAYMAEIVRAGIVSVDEGQVEAASSLGLTRLVAMRRIVLPQAMRVIIPPTGNEVISMLKTTSLASVVALAELLEVVQDIYNATYQIIPLLIVAAIWYLVVTSVLYVLQFYLERHFARGRVVTLPLGHRLLSALRIEHARVSSPEARR
jgi:polar amino acid transport system permease protein